MPDSSPDNFAHQRRRAKAIIWSVVSVIVVVNLLVVAWLALQPQS